MKNNKFAPVLLFVYKRLDTLKLTVASLQQNYLAGESELFVFSDAAKTSDDQLQINKVRDYIRTIDGFKHVYVYEADKNLGLATSIINGVTKIINEYTKVIVLEDDLQTSSNFLAYMNQALDFYQHNRKVFSVAGYTIPVIVPKEYSHQTYFLPRASSWGWATWKDRWENIDWQVSSFSEFKKDKTKIRAFSAGGSDMYGMLQKQMNGVIDSWAIRWCYDQYRSGTYTLCPTKSKVKNIGFNNMATHTNVFNRYETPLDEGVEILFSFPSVVKADKKLLSQFQSFYSLKARAIGKLKTYLYKAGIYKN